MFIQIQLCSTRFCYGQLSMIYWLYHRTYDKQRNAIYLLDFTIRSTGEHESANKDN